MNVVFDFGAVLFTWRPTDLMAECFAAQAPNHAAAAQLAHAVFSHPDWHDFDGGKLDMAVVGQRTAERLQLDAVAMDALLHSIGERLTPLIDTVAVLEQLHQQRQNDPELRLYYLSNMPMPYARTLERLHPFLQWFDGGVFSGDVKHIKPHPEIYQLLQARYALNPADTVFIDDLQANVQAARAQGWHGIHYQSAAQLQDELANFGVYQKGL